MSELDVGTVGELLAVVEPFEVGSGLAASALLRKSIGGAEVNVALSLARLGHSVGWAGAVGADPFGAEGLRTLRGAGVDVSCAVVDSTAPTGVYFKEVDFLRIDAAGGLTNHAYRSGSAASRLCVQDIDVDYLCSGRVLHLTGITALISDAGREVISHLVDLARHRRVHVSVDANIRRGLLRDREASGVLAPLLGGADTLFLSRSEASLLLATDDPDRIQTELGELSATTILMHDHRGAFAITSDDVVWAPARTVAVVDPTGAGDAFAAGYLSGWLDAVPMVQRLRRAEQCAAYAVTTRGDNPVALPRSLRDAVPATVDVEDVR